jgi:phage virion morphogenesis protein
MANGLSFTVDSAAIMAALARTVRMLDNPQALLADIGFELEGNIRYRFATKTDPAGQPWAALADSTKKSYNKKYEGVVPGSLLNRSGIMLESLTSNADANSVAVGFSVPYAIFHITGTRRMPRRDSLFAAIAANGSTGTLGAQDEADIIEIVEDHLRQALGGAA